MAIARRSPDHLSVTELLEEAKALDLSLPGASKEDLAAAISLEKSRRWLEENAEAIRSSNEYVERHGLPLRKYRTF